MTDRTDFLRAIALAPECDTTRLVYADFLDEHGEPERAELIRLQCGQFTPLPLCTLQYFTTQAFKRLRRDRNKIYANVGNRRGVGTAESGRLMAKARTIGEKRFNDYELERVKSNNRVPDLIRLHAAMWRRPPCVKCERGGWLATGVAHGECEDCHGTGSAGALSKVLMWNIELTKPGTWKHTISWVRGMPVVEVAFDEMGFVTNSNGGWAFAPDWLAWAIRAVKEEGAAFVLRDLPDGSVPGVLIVKASEMTRKGPSINLAMLGAAVTALVVEQAYSLTLKGIQDGTA